MTIVLFDGEMTQNYSQVYLCDASLPALSDDYTEEAVLRRVNAVEQAITVHVERELMVPFQVLLDDRRPDVDLADFDHVTQTALSVPSGEVVLAGLLAYAPDEPHFAVPAGRYGVLVTFAGLGSISEDGFEGEDHYAVHLWPDPAASGEVRVLKQWCR